MAGPSLAAAGAAFDGADTARPTAFPWRRALHVGLCLLRLPPVIFWAMTPIEFHAMAGGLSPRSPSLDRAGLAAMMVLFPD
ncbi:rcc01693 family protein [Rhizobium tumorigenes]|uniref:rcc01693 family protein n=1 Tax=Rhizobium tumorigenes TaxID=2041385 RepID=UPI00241EC5F4|nr:rcc01693 family protein [Rhizobium tumorigenes]WFS03004.1 phage tail assembly chaperone [Rhizobium tumorigenes]